MKSIILKSAIVLTLGVATGALAQTEIIKKNPQRQTESHQSVNVTTEQKAEIRQVITETQAEPVRDMNFEVNVGVAVPKTVSPR